MVNPDGRWLAKQGLFAGVRFDGNDRYDGNFAQTEMKSYIDNFFAKEIHPQRSYEQVREIQTEKETKIKNYVKKIRNRLKQIYTSEQNQANAKSREDKILQTADINMVRNRGR